MSDDARYNELKAIRDQLLKDDKLLSNPSKGRSPSIERILSPETQEILNKFKFPKVEMKGKKSNNKPKLGKCTSTERMEVESTASCSRNQPLPVTPTIDISNRFDVLQNLTDQVNTASTMPASVNPNSRQHEKQPPVVANGPIGDMKILINELKKITHQFVSYPNILKQQVTFITYSKDDRLQFMRYLQNNGFTCHTYTSKDDRKNTYVIKGLGLGWTEEEVLADLQAAGVEVIKLNAMRGGVPFFIMTTPFKTQPSDLKKIKHLLHTSVRIEPFVSKKQITQCKRCQRWGHVIANCLNDWNCVRCGERHSSHECPKKDRSIFPAKCANCGGAHPSSSTTCAVYIEKLESAKTKKKEAEVKKDQPGPTTRSKDWPKLPTKSATTHGSESVSASAPNGNLKLMDELRGELRQLDELIDLKKTIVFYKTLNARLRAISDKNERQMVFLEMILNMDSM